MAQDRLLTVSNIARELNAGKATIKFILKRFNKWIPGKEKNGQVMYAAGALQTIAVAIENLELGILPSNIEKVLSEHPQGDFAEPSVSADDDIRLSRNGMDLLNSLFDDIGEQQKRIAKAHEKRAEAEERKAVAIEKRAEAEEKKALAMNNIANALQEMNRLRGTAEQIAHQTVSALASDEIDSDMPALDEFAEDLPDETGSFDIEEQLDDLSLLVSETDMLDDLVLGEDLPQIEEEDLHEGFVATPDQDLNSLLEQDDLDRLVDQNPSDEPDEKEPDGLDDLSLLVDASLPGTDTEKSEQAVSEQLDDLSELIDSVSTESAHPPEPEGAGKQLNTDPGLDDLSELIDRDLHDETVETVQAADMDDLSMLIDASIAGKDKTDTPGPEAGDVEMDDLSLLIDPAKEADSTGQVQVDVKNDELDDLSKLIDTSDTGVSKSPEAALEKPDEPRIKIDFSPEDNLEKYKAEIIRIIIGFKKDGKDAQQVTDILNNNSIKTLSGKPEWSFKAVAQVYKFIESAA